MRAKYRLFYVSLRIQTYFRTLLNSLYPKSNVSEPESLNDFWDVNFLLCCWSIGIRTKVNLELILATSSSGVSRILKRFFKQPLDRDFPIPDYKQDFRRYWMPLSLLNWLSEASVKLWIRFMPLLSPNKIVHDTSKITENDRYNEREIIWHRAQTRVDIVSKFNQSWPEEVVNR